MGGAVPISVNHVSKRFGQTVALNDISLDVGAGEVFGLLGPNGAGKTTLIRSILDIIKPDSGTISLFGHAFGPADRDRIGYLPEERGLYPRQKVGAVLDYMGSLKGLSPGDARAARTKWLERFELEDAAGQRVDQLSKGNQQKAQIAATLLARPPILVLDEPLSGLDPVSARLAIGVIRECASTGQTVVLSTHQMNLVETLCTRVLMVAHGRAVLYGDLRDIKREFSGHAFRVRSKADYAACPLVARVERAGPQDAADVHLHDAGKGDQFLGWLAAQGAGVDSFERLSTPLEEIFVRVAESAS